MKITKRQLRKIIKEEKYRLLKEFGSEEYGRQTREFEPISGIDVPVTGDPQAWAKEMNGQVERDEMAQIIIYLDKEDYPTEKDFLGELPEGWDYEDLPDLGGYTAGQWIIYTGQYPAYGGHQPQNESKLQERSPAAAGMAAARHEGQVDYRWLAERVDQQARMLEQLLMDSENAMIMNDNKSLVDDFEKLVEDAFQLAVTFDRLGGG